MLERLAQAGLTLKLRKCRFAAKSLEYLSPELSCHGIRPLQRLVSAVQEFPRPKDAVEPKRFAHLAGYHKRFVAGFGSLMVPITKLLRKDVEWQWGAEQQEAFEQVKRVLTAKPLLIYPNFRLHFRVATDASTVGLGVCLMQGQGQWWQLVAYTSKVNSTTESKYGITELECLAVVWAIKLFRPYLNGRRFTIITDDSALKWLMANTNLTGKLHRWAITLQEFDFEIQHRPGNTNVVVDAISRMPAVATVRAAVGRRRRSRQRAQEHVTAIEQSSVTSQEMPGAEHEEMRTGSNRITTVENDHGDTAAIGVAPPTLQTAVMNENTGTYSGSDVQDREAKPHRGESSKKTRTGDRKRHTEETRATTRPLTRAAKRRAGNSNNKPEIARRGT
ncbi:unnamed protein product [Phytophthora fragariaefolia]|uniref:Unnamed protein product n=1 Tax=Phytophthora fragariaefolia TaxID=1490495 RepID=A0A9W6YKS0_9STRA|nr:unnamed protein product [Phytophthora fragariaefolia]